MDGQDSDGNTAVEMRVVIIIGDMMSGNNGVINSGNDNGILCVITLVFFVS